MRRTTAIISFIANWRRVASCRKGRTPRSATQSQESSTKPRKELLSATYLDPTNRVLRQRLAELIALEPGQSHSVTEPDLAGPVQLEYQQGTHSFDYRGDTQGAYEAVGKQFGVEVAFDGDLASRQVHFQVDDVDFPTAVRLLGDMTGHLLAAARQTPVFRGGKYAAEAPGLRRVGGANDPAAGLRDAG